MMKVIGFVCIAILLTTFGFMLFKDFCVGSCMRNRVFDTKAKCEWACTWSRG